LPSLGVRRLLYVVCKPFTFAELLPAAMIQFLIGDIGYLFSSDVGYFYDSLGKMFLKEYCKYKLLQNNINDMFD
jgi:hypothetical protein